jgi:hypothetical protein
MTTKLAVYNGALEHLGNRPLASLTESGQPRRALDAAWDAAVAYCLEAGQWRFAKRTVRLDYDPDVTPAWGYEYAFAIPSDHVRLTGMWADENLNQPLNDYREENGYWFANVTLIYLGYVSDDTQFGLDLGAWPSRFTEFVQVHLAAKTALNITGDKARRDDCIAMRDKQYLPDAIAIDAMQDPTRELPPGSWLRARHGTAWARRKDGQP